MIPENRRDDGLITTMSIRDNAEIVIRRRLYNRFGLLDNKRADAIMEGYDSEVCH